VSDYLVVHWYMGLSVVKHARQTLIQALRNEGIEFIPHGVRLIPKAP
jgi:hypothetical protein